MADAADGVGDFIAELLGVPGPADGPVRRGRGEAGAALPEGQGAAEDAPGAGGEGGGEEGGGEVIYDY